MVIRRLGGWLALALLACNAAPAAEVCTPGGAVACRCAEGAQGVAVCRDDASGFGDCRCDGRGGGGGSSSSLPSSANASSGPCLSCTGGASGTSTNSEAASTATSVAAASSTGTGGASTATGTGGASSATSATSATGTGGASTATSATGTGGTGQGGSSSSSSGCQGGSSSTGTGGQGGANTWGATILSSGQATVAGVAVDTADDTVIAGSFTGAIDFGCGPVQAVANDIYVAKYASTGRLLWAKTFTQGNAFALAVDPSGNILVGGDWVDTLDFGSGTPFSNNHGPYAFVAKLDPNGGYVWQKSWGGFDTDLNGGNAHVRAIAADGLGNLVIIGNFFGPLYFDPVGGVDSHGVPNFFVASLDPQGAPVWAQFPGYVTGPMALAVDALGDAVIAAQSMSALFTPTTLNQCQIQNCVSLAKLGPGGQLLFSNAYGLSLSPDVRAIGVDASDEIAIAGAVPSGTAIDFGGGFVTAPRYPASYVARFDGAGYFIASSGYGAHNTSPGGPASATPNALACDAAGACELAGAFQGELLDFGCGPVNGVVVSPIPYLARLDAADACVASESLSGSNGNADVAAVGLTSNGDTIAAGTYAGPVDLGSGPLPIPSGTGVFVLRRPP